MTRNTEFYADASKGFPLPDDWSDCRLPAPKCNPIFIHAWIVKIALKWLCGWCPHLTHNNSVVKCCSKRVQWCISVSDYLLVLSHWWSVGLKSVITEACSENKKNKKQLEWNKRLKLWVMKIKIKKISEFNRPCSKSCWSSRDHHCASWWKRTHPGSANEEAGKKKTWSFFDGAQKKRLRY